MRIIFMGTPDFAVGTLEALIEAGHDIAGVVTQPDKPKGRGKNLMAPPVKQAAIARGLAVYQPKKVRDPEFIQILRKLEPQIIVVVAFGQIIPQEILELAPFGCINVHGSLLPKYRGAAPIQWAVIDGEKESGVTIMKMDAGLDTGDMISKEIVPLEDKETGGSLFDKLAKAGARLCVQTLPSIENETAVYEKQPEESPTAYASMIDKKMGCIQWEEKAKTIEQLIRGLNPWPSAYTYLQGKTLKIWEADVLSEESGKEPGEVVRTDKTGLYIQTGDKVLCVKELQLEGKKRMEAGAFLRGYEIPEGTRLKDSKE
ncbi:methionyl-tRNA formyltransferase [Lactonifactor longoviformis]|uniref:methionyl-tRNA formyltransferase n=1 Tax=Lactonifactor longoviformis TaxID=341220 RepID=UPI001D00B7D6|nr:methionyl-tRNA formyltransferase [Lactonifactor longoviformis]MCB5712067.1 methionyl-tRNA formyltransferase [Lactonifactor longoviformis]MCB5716111.1 methionyl-tRNA formyltransferase [Lactonifactor longoviformis]